MAFIEIYSFKDKIKAISDTYIDSLIIRLFQGRDADKNN